MEIKLNLNHYPNHRCNTAYRKCFQRNDNIIDKSYGNDLIAKSEKKVLHKPGSVNGHGPCTNPDHAAKDTTRDACIMATKRLCHSGLRFGDNVRVTKYRVVHPTQVVTAPGTEYFLMLSDNSKKSSVLFTIL